MVTQGLAKNLKYWVAGEMGSRAFFFHFLPFSRKNRWKKITPHTDLCVEGFPRSANSFFSIAFRLYNPEARFAHHMHAPMQVIKAAEYEIPCVLLIRPPVDAIASVLVVDRSLSIRLAIQSYIDFYSAVWPVRDRCIIADFKETTKCPDRIIERVNQRYGTSFLMEPITPEIREIIFQRLQDAQKDLNLPEHLVAIPTAKKAQIKQAVLQELSEHPLLSKAAEIYQRFLDISCGISSCD